MFVEIVRRSMMGLGFAAMVTFAILTMVMVQNVDVPVSIVWKNMLGSMVLGMYFGTASLIFDYEAWSPLRQTIVHFMLSVSTWLLLALYMGWLPLAVIPIMTGIGIFIMIYLLFWIGAYWYFKKTESEMNRAIR